MATRAAPAAVPTADAVAIRVLLVEDSAVQAGLVQAHLGDPALATQAGVRFGVTRVADLAGGLAQLTRDDRFDVVLLDLTLPDSYGLATLDAVTAATSLPVVVLSAAEEQLGVSVLEHGAQDYVVKDARSLPALPRALRYAVTRRAMQRDLEAALVARDRADERLRTFVSMASHELRSPIAALRGLSTLLTSRWEQLPVDDRRGIADRIDRRIGHAQAVATLYLNAAVGEDRVHAATGDVDLERLVGDVVASVPTPPALVAVDPGTVRFDPSHLAAILVNLLTNAAKYGGDPVRLDGDADALVVSDAGAGVAAEDLEGLFTAWDRTSRPGTDSTGLGLALSAQLARANGATLGHERVDGRTRFVLCFGEAGDA